MKKKIIIIGGGGHARVLKDILDISGKLNVIGFTDVKPNHAMGIKYLGDDSVLKKYSAKEVLLVNGIGSVKLPEKRREIYERFKNKGYSFYSLVHPNCVISKKVRLKEGVQIIGGVVINIGTLIEENVIINTSSSVDHDCSIGAHSHIAPGVTISGDVKIGRCCHIGTGAKIIQGITIGDRVLVGAGAVILDDIRSEEIILGIPGRAYIPEEVK